MQDCRIDETARLGAEGNGAAIFKHSMIWERSCILASAIGTMERQLERSLAYATTRKQFGKPVGKFQSVANRLVDMKIRLETSRLLLYKTGWLRVRGEDAAAEVAMAKLYLSECFVQSSLDAIQVHGGYGYTAITTRTPAASAFGITRSRSCLSWMTIGSLGLKRTPITVCRRPRPAISP